MLFNDKKRLYVQKWAILKIISTTRDFYTRGDTHNISLTISPNACTRIHNIPSHIELVCGSADLWAELRSVEYWLGDTGTRRLAINSFRTTSFSAHD